MTAPPDPLVPVDALRDAARRAVDQASLRSVACDIGMSAPGLQGFLDGSPPRAATVRKLREWFVRAAARDQWVSGDSVKAALWLLLDSVPSKGRAKAERIVLEAVERAYRETAGKVPKWLSNLLK